MEKALRLEIPIPLYPLECIAKAQEILKEYAVFSKRQIMVWLPSVENIDEATAAVLYVVTFQGENKEQEARELKDILWQSDIIPKGWKIYFQDVKVLKVP